MKTLIKVIVVLTMLAAMSIPFITYANAVTDGSSIISCKAKGFAIHQTHLQVFVDVSINQDVHFTMPVMFNDAIVSEVTRYVHAQGLEEYLFENTVITIMKVSLY